MINVYFIIKNNNHNKCLNFYLIIIECNLTIKWIKYKFKGF